MKFEIAPFKHIFNEEWQSSELGQLLAKSYYYNQLNFSYEEEYTSGRYLDVGFVISCEKKPLMAMAIYAFLGELSNLGRPLSFFVVDEIDEDLELEAKILFFQTLEKIIKENEIKHFSFNDHSVLNDYFFDVIKAHETMSFATVDLLKKNTTIQKNIRKSYRSLIHWGEREIKAVFIDHANPDYENFLKFREFHIEVAGKETRSKSSWDLQFEMIKAGHAFLILGYLSDRLVSGALILVGSEEAYYGVAVNDRKIMGLNKPLGHSTIYRSIIHAKSLGLKKFNLGYVSFPTMNEKEKHIGIFKKGFSSHIESQLIVKVELA